MSTYTESMIAAMRKVAPLNLDKAKDLASGFGVSHRSVISKAKSLGIEYVKAGPRARSSNGPTKAQLADAIRQSVGLPARSGDLTQAELDVILSNLA